MHSVPAVGGQLLDRSGVQWIPAGLLLTGLLLKQQTFPAMIGLHHLMCYVAIDGVAARGIERGARPV